MELEKFKDANRNELSMIEVAHAILNEHGKEMVFADLVNEIQTFLGKSDQEIRERLPQFYMDLNFDGSFISLGENTWGLRSWYAIDEVGIHTNRLTKRLFTPMMKTMKIVRAKRARRSMLSWMMLLTMMT